MIQLHTLLIIPMGQLVYSPSRSAANEDRTVAISLRDLVKGQLHI